MLFRSLFDKLIKIKYDIPNNRLDLFEEYEKEIEETILRLKIES